MTAQILSYSTGCPAELTEPASCSGDALARFSARVAPGITGQLWQRVGEGKFGNYPEKLAEQRRRNRFNLGRSILDVQMPITYGRPMASGIIRAGKRVK